MHINRINIAGFKMFREFSMPLDKHLNVVVGDNETGKTSLLEAINLVLCGQLDGRNVQYELNPYIFNADMVSEYFAKVATAEPDPPPRI